MTDRLEDKPDVAIHPPTIIASALLLGFMLRIFLGGGLGFIPQAFAEGMGGVMLLASMVMMVASVSAFAEGGETLRPATPSDQLFTGGPYRYTRNPIYLAMMLFGAGFGVTTLNLWVIVTTLIAGVIFNFFVIPQEEEYLARRFGEEYGAYKRKVRRWV